MGEGRRGAGGAGGWGVGELIIMKTVREIIELSVEVEEEEEEEEEAGEEEEARWWWWWWCHADQCFRRVGHSPRASPRCQAIADNNYT